MIFDTDVLIWVFRGHEGAAQLVEGTDDRRISMVTYAEFIQGVRNRQELKKIKNLLNDFAFQTLPLTEDTGHVSFPALPVGSVPRARQLVGPVSASKIKTISP